MIPRRAALAVLAGSTAALLGGCGAYGGNSYRFRMTVEVETPQGLRTGSSVMEIYASKNVKVLAEEQAGSSGLKGEAVAVDLGDRLMFVLLQLPDAKGTLQGKVTVALAPEAKEGIDAYVSAVRKLGGWSADYKAELPREDWPIMVQFGDINDPKSVEPVNPVAINVKRILLETTDDDVTSGIENILGWLPGHVGSLMKRPKDMLVKDMPISGRLTVRDFTSELNK